jgi:hypothetical protein
MKLSIRAQAKLYGISKSVMAADRAAGCPATAEGGRAWRMINRRPYLRLSHRIEPLSAAEIEFWRKVYG